MKRLILLFVILALGVAPQLTIVSADTRPLAEDRGASGLAFTLRRLQTIASLLHTGAHPDDESTELLAYVARGEGARVAYLSLNRGEGGQNGIGPELWEGLGILRTEELLAARKLDGAEQYFTRAFDFGFTRSADETLKKWNREEVLGDMVRVIRTMRPMVVVNGFSGTNRDGHGQHQVAGMLTPEAIKAAADATRFPEQIREGLQPWSVLKVYSRIFGQSQGQGPVASFDVGKFDPILGRSYAELAAEGRSKHRSQDFGMIQARGSQPRSYPRLQSTVEAPDRESSLFTGIDTTVTGIARFAGSSGERLTGALKRIAEAVARANADFRIEDPERIAPHLAAGLKEVRALRASLHGLEPASRANVDNLLARKERDFADALQKAHGVIVDAFSSSEITTPGGTVDVAVNVYLGQKAGTAPDVRGSIQTHIVAPESWTSESLQVDAEPAPAGPQMRSRERADVTARFRVRVPLDEAPSQPYWLIRERTRDQFDWDEKMPQTLPFARPQLSAQVTMTLAGESVTIAQPVEFRFADKSIGEIRRELKIAPVLALTLRPALVVIPSGSADRARDVSLEIVHHFNGATSATVKLELPQGWRVEGEPRTLAFSRAGESASLAFRVTPPANALGTFELKAVAQAGGREYRAGHTVIAYPHIEPHFVYHPARTKAEVFDVKVAPGLKVGYIMGSGDDVPEALAQLGVNVKMIGESELTSGDLSIYDTIVLGIRVYEVRDDVIANNKRLLDYVANGGTLIVQYNKQEFGRTNVAPYPIKLDGGLRVTDETAPVTVLIPDHKLFTYPNKITTADWDGWVQERGLYFLNEWDPRYTPLLSAADESGRQLAGGELIAKVGKGNYVFTGYAWFRQLPAGVPGAYRLFANLISLSKAVQ
ncbi:MAG: PIG-L family deacetylase [Acidobacteriota bacterium]